MGGHSLGNLIISALQRINDGDLLRAIQDAQELLDTAGRVLPVTLANATLCAELEDGGTICGETEIDTRGLRDPGRSRPYCASSCRTDSPLRGGAARDPARRRHPDRPRRPVHEYLAQPPGGGGRRGDPPVGRPEDLHHNLMTKHGETDGYRAPDFVRQIHAYLGGRVDRVVAHDGSFPEHLLGRYAGQDQHPVPPDEEELRQQAPDVIVDDLLAIHQDHLVRHDADHLLQAIFAPPWHQSLARTEAQARVGRRAQGW